MLPASLQRIYLQQVECSSEWLYSLLITLSTLGHPVEFELLMLYCSHVKKLADISIIYIYQTCNLK
ncbi:hypothetical protein DPMN_061151 [Dreissena polymorpha]|uniref:Uncharacterized protein n=1 Tax=Dreissena polymorpha TaxID=45954 RepID=A0A9D4C7B1_DREPO|nr:hypothetical protein DPMN_061151 [Dreissena polymorpha]